MKYQLWLLNYNNYFNRIVQMAGDTPSYYAQYLIDHQDSVNFNIGDGITTEVIVNSYTEGDYLLVCDEAATEIYSRWFILENEKIRNGQYKLSLKRDVISDNFDKVIHAPCYVEKGTLKPTDPMIYNSEGMLFNQIKKNELLLKDRSKSAWIVGYISRDYLKPSGDPEHPTTDKTINGKYNVLQAAAIDAADLPWEFNSAPQIVGNTSGYRLEIKSGSYRYYISYTYRGQTYSNSYSFNESLTLHFDKLGRYKNYEFVNDHPSMSSGSIVRYTADSDFDIYADSKGSLILANDLGDWIAKHDLAIKSVPEVILNEQTSANATPAELLAYNGRIVKYANRYYRILAEQIEDPVVDYSGTDYPILENNLDEFIGSWNANHNNFQPHLARAAKKLVMKAESAGVRITPIAITEEQLKVDIPIQEHRIHLNDAPYDMFAIPYGEIHLDKADVTCNRDSSLAMAFYAAAEMGSGVVYDIQLVPYCPCLDFITDKGTLDEDYGQEGYEYTYIKDTQDNVKSIVIWCSTSNGTIDLAESLEMNRPHYTHTDTGTGLVNNDVQAKSFRYMPSKLGGDLATVTVKDRKFALRKVVSIDNVVISDASSWRPLWTDVPTLDQNLHFQQNMNTGVLVITYSPSTAPRRTSTSQISVQFDYQWETETEVYENDLATDIKVSDNCDSYRLVSPNYNGIFEFSVAKNGGKVDLFNVDYTYKPHNPYIHVNPKFDGIYGKDWNDARGLICGGNFSLPVVTSAFTDYEVANKNYEAIFAREIQHMDVSHEIQRQQATVGAITGSITGATSGATSGAMAGSKFGPYGAAVGAVAGGVIGGVGSLAGGAMDLGNLDKAQKEAKSFATDLHNMNLRNIQAIPYSLAKTSSYTYNNKIWPMVEYYSCTEEEKRAFKLKLTYNGMTVNKITTLVDVTETGTVKFVKGQMIRLEDLSDDSHMAYTIYDEINKGVYL